MRGFTGDLGVYELKNAKTMDQHGKSKSSALAAILAWNRGGTLIGQKQEHTACMGILRT
jgi:hypothetical protein